MSDYSVKDHIAYKMGFKAGQESQAATIAGLQAAVMQCRSLTELLKPQADRIAELEAALRDVLPYVDTCNSSHREAQAKGYAALTGGKDE